MSSPERPGGDGLHGQPPDGAGGRPSGISVADFAVQLRELREHAGRPSYRQLAQLAHYSHTALSQAFVRAGGGDVKEWSARWHKADRAARQPGVPPYSPEPGLARTDCEEVPAPP